MSFFAPKRATGPATPTSPQRSGESSDPPTGGLAAPRTNKGDNQMAKGIRFYQTGAPEVMKWESLQVGAPGAGEVRVRHAAVGLNFADTYFRSGLYPTALPAGMGVEAAGIVEAVGTGVTAFVPGDRVTYTGSPLGAYST